jgi:site-specific DNA recombinase
MSQPLRVAAYLRVSTVKQAENDLSLPDQQRQVEEYCARRSMTLIEVFNEHGASALDENRPVFQEMIDKAVSAERPFDGILVHSLSRFSRDALHSEIYVRKLRKAGVEVISITQEFSADPTGELVRKILNVFDEHSSHENAKHTHRAMRENARQGFWNGSRPPFGYKTVVGERRGSKDKKILVIDEAEARIVRQIFDLYMGVGGPAKGIKAIVDFLNARGITQRGHNFGIGRIHELLQSSVYMGKHFFNRFDSRLNVPRPPSEWVEVPVPSIVPEETFNSVQATLRSRNPRLTPPRVVTGPTLLTGITHCVTCGGAMTIATGKGGRYRYYACSTRIRKGDIGCSGNRIRMEKLDAQVLAFLADNLLTGPKIKATVDAFVNLGAGAIADGKERLRQAREAQSDIEAALKRLLSLVESGAMDPADPVLRDRLTQIRLQRQEAIENVQSLERQSSLGRRAYDPARLPILAKRLREVLAAGPIEVQKGYIQLFVSRIVVGNDGIELKGPSMAIAHAVTEGLPEPSALVPTFVQRWRPREESNLRPAV